MNNYHPEPMAPLDDWVRQLLALPERASSFGDDIDHLHYYVLGISMLVALGITIAGGYLLLRYARSRGPRSDMPHHPSTAFEVSILLAPLVFFLIWFFIGFRTFIQMETPPPEAMNVYVMAKKWMWKFAYEGGPNAINTLRVPAHRPVRLLMTSRDVIHSFYVPELRVKQDVQPARTTQLWFNATKPGVYDIFCTEYCGTGHSVMAGKVEVLEPADFDRWMSAQRQGLTLRQDSGGPLDPEAQPMLTMVQEGRKAAAELQCLKCHSVDGSPHIGPTWLGLYHRNERLRDNTEVFADEAYLTKSMMDPMAQIVQGYAPVMPTYQGRMTAPQTAAIVEYIKSLQDDRLAQAPNPGPAYEPINVLR